MKYLKLYSDDNSYMADKPNLGKLWVASTKSEKHVYYSSEINNSLCFTAMEDNASVQMGLIDEGGTSAGWQAKSFYYKKNDDVEWTEWEFNNNASSKITLNKGDKLYVMSDSYNSCCDFDSHKFYHFTIEGKNSASGNIMSLLNFTPVLPNYAFLGLFIECPSLVSAPELPATTLAEGCYTSMFYGCQSLTQAPELPATTLAESCYSSMFYGCTSLVQAPELPATTLVSNCYFNMFFGCSKLNYIKALFTTTPSRTYTDNWVSGVSSTGTFVKSSAATWNVTGIQGIPTGWTVQVEGGVTPEPEPERDYLCFTSTGNSTISMTQNGTPNTSANKVIQYKLNNGQWQNWDLSDVSLSDGDKMYLKSDDTIPMSESDGIYNETYKQFSMYGDGSIAASGNIMSLLNFSDTLTDYAFYRLFQYCSSLTQAPELPATTLANSCYQSMFSGCSSLAQAPELPATTLANGCYQSMFYGCSSLTQAPTLPATTLANGCYQSMFDYCSSLTQAPTLPATTLAESCYQSMFNDCSSLTQSPELPATTLANGCYQSIFSGCSSLTQAPELPATTLADSCYNSMFQFCSSLTQAPTLPATTLVAGCYNTMFSGCSSLAQAPTLPATTLAPYCYYTMFNDCSSLTQAPELPATTLAESCYQLMFCGCSSLTQAPELPATTLAESCYSIMFMYCSSLTKAPELPATTLATNCYNTMFSDCSSLTQAPTLPATTLVEGCYSSMFSGCSSLTQAPELPATTLADSCYSYMFSGCKKLNYIKALFTTTPSDTYTNSWVNGVSKTGTFVKSSDATWDVTGAYGIPSGWTVQVEVKDYLCFTSTGDSTIGMTQHGKPSTNKVIQYKLNDGQWQNWDLSAVTLHDGDKMYLKSDNTPMSTAFTTYKQFVMTGSIAASGNIMSLLNFSDKIDRYAFYYLFRDCTSLTVAPELPATKLEISCYYGMFDGCTSLTATPELPATILAYCCYIHMFKNCTSLTTAHVLPATKLDGNCYDSMFSGCSSLTKAPELPATTLANDCYNNMFSGCKKLNYVKAMFTTDPTAGSYLNNWLKNVSATGTFVKNATATWTNEQAKIPTGWEVTTV